MRSFRTKADLMIADVALISGLQKYFPNATLTVLSQPQTLTQMVAVIQARVDKAQAVIDARAAYHAAVLACEAEYAQSASYVSGVTQGIIAMYANSPAILADFKLSTRKTPTPLTAAEKLVAAQKREATRAARHTMGSVQKAAVVGSLTGPVVVDPNGTVTSSSASSAAPSAPTPAATPATPAVTNGASSTAHA